MEKNDILIKQFEGKIYLGQVFYLDVNIYA